MDLEHELDLCPLHWDHEVLVGVGRWAGSSIEGEEGFVVGNQRGAEQVVEDGDG